MAQVSALETTVQVKSPAKLYDILKTPSQQFLTDYIDKIQYVELVEGDIENPDSEKVWKGTIEGKEELFKERMALVDEENKTLIGVAVGGDVRELYKSYRSIFKLEDDGTVKLRIEYEKLNENVPPPDKYLEFVTGFLKEMDDRITE